MRNILLAGALLPMIIGNAWAQVSIGNRAGLSLFKSSFSGPEHMVDGFKKNLNNTPGFSGALPIEIMLGDHFALQPEIGFTQKGKETGSLQQGAFVTTLNYLDFSLLAKARIGRGNLQAELMLGPGLAYGLTRRQKAVNIITYYPSSDNTLDFPDTGLSLTDLYVTGGAGVSYRIGVPRIFLNYRYVYGISTIYGDELVFTDINGATIGEFKEFNRGSIISLGFLVPLSRSAWVPAE